MKFSRFQWYSDVGSICKGQVSLPVIENILPSTVSLFASRDTRCLISFVDPEVLQDERDITSMIRDELLIDLNLIGINRVRLFQREIRSTSRIILSISSIITESVQSIKRKPGPCWNEWNTITETKRERERKIERSTGWSIQMCTLLIYSPKSIRVPPGHNNRKERKREAEKNVH